MPYIETSKVAAMRKAIRAALPEYKISIAKRHHSGVDVHVLSGPILDVPNVNVFWFKEHLGPDKLDRPEAIKVIQTIIDCIFAVEKPRTLVEDGDYGNVPTFYYDVSFGKWNQPYVCTDPDAADRLEAQQAFRQIDREKEYQSWKANRKCGIVTLAPDDLRIPCILPAGHSGFCDTGRA